MSCLFVGDLLFVLFALTRVCCVFRRRCLGSTQSWWAAGCSVYKRQSVGEIDQTMGEYGSSVTGVSERIESKSRVDPEGTPAHARDACVTHGLEETMHRTPLQLRNGTPAKQLAAPAQAVRPALWYRAALRRSTG